MGLQILGQVAPVLDTEVVLFTAASPTVVSTLFAANRGSNAIRFSIGVVPSGEALALQHWIYYQILCPPNDTFASTTGLSLSTGDRVVVTASGTMSFSVFGEAQ